MRRIQRRRTKGWRMPPRTLYVGRPSPWGNQWEIGDRWFDAETLAFTIIEDRASAIRAYRQDIGLLEPSELVGVIAPLRGKDLACWCPLDQPCHADVLLELAA